MKKKHSWVFDVNPFAFDVCIDVCTPQGTLLERTFSRTQAEEVYQKGGAKVMYLNHLDRGTKTVIARREF